jgi:hypothetical protein
LAAQKYASEGTDVATTASGHIRFKRGTATGQNPIEQGLFRMPGTI